MKRKLIAFLLAVSTLFAAGCVNSGKPGEIKGPDTAEPTAEPMPAQIKESEADAVTSRWVCTELAFALQIPCRFVLTAAQRKYLFR